MVSLVGDKINLTFESSTEKLVLSTNVVLLLLPWLERPLSGRLRGLRGVCCCEFRLLSHVSAWMSTGAQWNTQDFFTIVFRKDDQKTLWIQHSFHRD